MQKPLFLLAYANDRRPQGQYLRNLPDEQRRIRAALEIAKDAGLCDYVECYNATLADILAAFQKYRDRIAVFHYAGHAESYELLLETPAGGATAIDGRGLAAFLGQQRGLEMVFLNACATAPQAESLLAANVSLVIATAQVVDDDVATEFADWFYRALASGASIGKAYREAQSALRARQPISLWRDLKPPAVAVAGAAWPWSIHVRPGAERSSDWNLPEAAHSPLFGLPQPARGDLPPRPFRHLLWFGPEQAEIFFGRGHAIRELYECATMVDGAPIVLFYGQAGVGKSSVLAAGLLPRLRKVAEVFYARRDRNEGLAKTLEKVLAAGNDPLADAWCRREREFGRPLIVVLDQVEEAYTRAGGPDVVEVNAFLEVTADLFARTLEERPLGKLILSFRKEWLPEIEQQLLERKVFLRKLFLARLDREGVIEAITGIARDERLAKHYNLTISDGVAEVIADDLLSDSESPLAPTLQILLTKLWDAAPQTTDGRRHFHEELYQRLKKEGILLGDFLDQQLTALGAKRPADVESGLTLDLLAFHTTPLGTAEQRKADELEQHYSHRKDAASEIVELLKGLYILADPGGTVKATRLAHDTLAPIVRERFATSQRPGQRARRIIEARGTEWMHGATGTPLDDADLRLVESGIAAMRATNSDEQRLIRASRQAVRVRRRWRWAVLSILLLLSLALVSTGGFLFIRDRQLTARNRELAQQAAQQYMQEAQDAIRTHDVTRRVFALSSVLSTAPLDDPLRVSAMAALIDQVPGMPQLLADLGPVGAGALAPDRSIAVIRRPDGTVETWDVLRKQRLSSPAVGGGLSQHHRMNNFFDPVISRSGRFAALVIPSQLQEGSQGPERMRLVAWEIGKEDVLVDYEFSSPGRRYPEWGPKDLLIVSDKDENSFLAAWRLADANADRAFTLSGGSSSLAPDDKNSIIVNVSGKIGALRLSIVNLDRLDSGTHYDVPPAESIEQTYVLPYHGSLSWHADKSFDVGSASPYHCEGERCIPIEEIGKHPNFLVSAASPWLEVSLGDDDFSTEVKPSTWDGEYFATSAPVTKSLFEGALGDGLRLKGFMPPHSEEPEMNWRAGPRRKTIIALAGGGELREIDLGALSTAPVRMTASRLASGWTSDLRQLWILSSAGHVIRWPVLLNFTRGIRYPMTADERRRLQRHRSGENLPNVPGPILGKFIDSKTSSPVVAYYEQGRGNPGAGRVIIAKVSPEGVRTHCEGSFEGFVSFSRDGTLFLQNAASGLEIRSTKSPDCPRLIEAVADESSSWVLQLLSVAWEEAYEISVKSQDDIMVTFVNSTWKVTTKPEIQIRDGVTNKAIVAPSSITGLKNLWYVALSKDGRRLATHDPVTSSYAQSCYRVWDLSTGVMIFGPLCQGSEGDSAAVFSSDGGELILPFEGGFSYRYYLGPNQPQDWPWASPSAIAALTGLTRSPDTSILSTSTPDISRQDLDLFEKQLTADAKSGDAAAVHMLNRLRWWCGGRKFPECGASGRPIDHDKGGK